MSTWGAGRWTVTTRAAAGQGAREPTAMTSMTTADAPARSAIVVVNYRSHRLLDTNFGFADGLAGSVHVIVVDNYSGPEERIAIGSLCESRGWILLGSDRNVGYGAAVNLGAAEAFRLGCTCVLLVNPDATLTADVADQLLRSCRRDPRTAVSPILVNSAGEVCYRGAEFGLSTGRTRGLGPAPQGPSGPARRSRVARRDVDRPARHPRPTLPRC